MLNEVKYLGGAPLPVIPSPRSGTEEPALSLPKGSLTIHLSSVMLNVVKYLGRGPLPVILSPRSGTEGSLIIPWAVRPVLLPLRKRQLEAERTAFA